MDSDSYMTCENTLFDAITFDSHTYDEITALYTLFDAVTFDSFTFDEICPIIPIPTTVTPKGGAGGLPPSHLRRIITTITIRNQILKDIKSYKRIVANILKDISEHKPISTSVLKELCSNKEIKSILLKTLKKELKVKNPYKVDSLEYKLMMKNKLNYKKLIRIIMGM